VLYIAVEVQDILIKSGMFPGLSQIRAWRNDVVIPFTIDASQWIIHTAAQTGIHLKAIITKTKNFPALIILRRSAIRAWLENGQSAWLE
jgi:hypothetical protein